MAKPGNKLFLVLPFRSYNVIVPLWNHSLGIRTALWKNAFYFNYPKHNILNIFLRNKLSPGKKYECSIGVIDSFDFISDVKCILQMLQVSNFQPLLIFGTLLFDPQNKNQCLFRVN